MKKLIVLLSITLMVLGLGCAALSQYVTPAEIDQNAVRYVVEAQVADFEDYEGWQNLVKSERLVKDVDIAYTWNRQELDQAIEREDMKHSIYQGVAVRNHKTSIQREEMLFGETGLLSLGLSMAGFGTLTGLVGLARKRPGDITAPEMEQALATVTGQTEAELSIRDKQFVQLVKGVQDYLDSDTNGKNALKFAMDKHQDIDTRAAVAVVKAG